MKKSNIWLFISSALVMHSGFSADGQVSTGPALTYTVTLKQVDLCTDSSCTTSHTLVSKTSAMDIASASVGGTVGSYSSTMELPAMGTTYTHMRNTLDRTFTIKGYALSDADGSTYCYTDGSAGTSTTLAQGTLAATSSLAAASASDSQLELPTGGVNVTTTRNGSAQTVAFSSYDSEISIVDADDFTFTKALTSPYVYTGITPLIDIAFETSGGVSSMEMGGGDASDDCNLFPGKPGMIITIQ